MRLERRHFPVPARGSLKGRVTTRRSHGRNQRHDRKRPATPPFPMPSLEDLQHWTFVMGRAQQMMMEHLAQQMGEAAEKAAEAAGPPRPERIAQSWPGMNLFADPAKLMEQQAQLWTEGLGIWQRALAKAAGGRRRGERAFGAGREGGPRPALRRARMARQSALRHDPADLFADFRADARLGRRDRGRGRRRPARSCASRRAPSSTR